MTTKQTLLFVVLAGLVLSLVLAGIFSPWASSHPDGLEYAVEQVGTTDDAPEAGAARVMVDARPDVATEGGDMDVARREMADNATEVGGRARRRRFLYIHLCAHALTRTLSGDCFVNRT